MGADGIGSTIARLVGAPMERVAASATAIVYGYWDGLPVDDYALFYRPDVAAGFFPTNGGQTCVFGATGPRRFRSLARASGVVSSYARLLGEAAPGVLDPGDTARAPERVRTFTARPGFLRTRLRARLGSGRRRRLLQGPDHLARPHRRPPRRRAPGRRHRQRPHRRGP